MKTITLILLTSCIFQLSAQSQKKSCAILNINQVGRKSTYSPEILGNITRREFSKLGVYEILYAEDIKPIIKYDTTSHKNSFNCYSKQCLIKVGEKIKTDKMLSGQIEHTNNEIIISFRVINVENGKIEYSITKEFLNLNDQLKNMIIISLREMIGLENDKELERLLIKKFSRENYINNEGINRLNLSGTRMGIVTLLGSNKEIIKSSEAEGGFEAVPIFFNFGYQFESQYLNNGRIQGLFELIPSITGLEQGLAMPSLTLLHGIRDNKTGFEFAFGPTFGISPIATGYLDNNDEWHLEDDWKGEQINPLDSSITKTSNPYTIVNRLDKRGNYKLSTGFLIGVGFSLKSGDINIPINLYTVLQKKSFRVGISIGINAKARKNKYE